MTRLTSVAYATVLVLLIPVLTAAQGFVRLQTAYETGTISANGDSVVLLASRVGGFGSVKIQTLDSYTGDLEVQCAVDGVNYNTDAELKLTAADSSSPVTSISDAVGIWDVANAGGCRAIRVIAVGGFAATDTMVVISATQAGGGGGSGGSGGVVAISEGGNTATVSAGGELAVTCADCSGSGVSHVDDAAFTAATDDVVPTAGIFDDASPDSINEGDAGAVRMSANRNLYTTIRDAAGNERGLAIDANGAIASVVSATNLDVQSGGADLVSSATVTTIFGADAIFGTAGTADADVLTIQGVESMTPIQIADNGGSLTVDGAVTVSGTNIDVQIGGSDTLSVVSNGANIATETTLASTLKAEDSAHASGNVGIMALAVRQDSHTDLAADGDYIPFTVDADGGLRVSIVAGAGTGGTAAADDADFTAGTTSFTPVGGFYQSTVTACTDGDVCVAGVTAQRALKATLFDTDGNAMTPSVDWSASAAIGVTAPGTMAEAKDFDGSALPLTASAAEGDAIPAASSLYGIQYVMVVSEDGALERGTSTTPYVMVGGKTDDSAAPGTNNVGTLPCIATAANPSSTDGRQVGCSQDLLGRERIMSPDVSETDILDTTVDESTAVFDMNGVEGITFTISGDWMDADAELVFEVRRPDGNWNFLAGFSMHEPITGTLRNDFEASTGAGAAAVNGTWIATGTTGFDQIRVRTNTPGDANATINWRATSRGEYKFAQIFGDWPAGWADVAVTHPFGWPVMVGGTAFLGNSEAPMDLSTMPDITNAVDAADVNSNDRMRFTTSVYGELRTLNSDKAKFDATITTAGPDCTVATNCVIIPLEGTQAITFTLSGTWDVTALLLPELCAELDDTCDYAVVLNTITYAGGGHTFLGPAQNTTNKGNARYTVLNPHGARYFRLRANDADGVGGITGTINVDIVATNHPIPHPAATDNQNAMYVRQDNAARVSCGADNIGATLTELSSPCAAATVGALDSIYITDIVAQSTTSTAGQFILRSGTGTNCGTNTASVFPSAATVVRLTAPPNTVEPATIHLNTPIKVTADHGLCVLGVATNTVTIQVNGFVTP